MNEYLNLGHGHTQNTSTTCTINIRTAMVHFYVLRLNKSTNYIQSISNI